MRFMKKPIVIDAEQWFVNGDHSRDHEIMNADCLEAWPSLVEYKKNVEGAIVRRFRRPGVSGKSVCRHCGKVMHVHGWIDTLLGDHIVCPGDWIITSIQGEHYPCKPDIFSATYEAVP